MASVQPAADLAEHLRFIGRLVRNPRTVGALAPSSRSLAMAMVAPLAHSAPATPARPRSIVELGPGTGAFTRAIFEHLRPGDRFLAVELESVFVDALHERWPALDCVCASAESLCALVAERRLDPVDHIVSGLPFATLPTDITRRIVEAIGRTLRPGGTFTTFHYLQS